MPEIQAFRAIRYNLGQVGSLSDVVAPPYDVIDPELQDRLYRRHPCNIVPPIRTRPSTSITSSMSTRAAPTPGAASWRG